MPSLPFSRTHLEARFGPCAIIHRLMKKCAGKAPEILDFLPSKCVRRTLFSGPAAGLPRCFLPAPLFGRTLRTIPAPVGVGLKWPTANRTGLQALRAYAHELGMQRSVQWQNRILKIVAQQRFAENLHTGRIQNNAPPQCEVGTGIPDEACSPSPLHGSHNNQLIIRHGHPPPFLSPKVGLWKSCVKSGRLWYASAKISLPLPGQFAVQESAAQWPPGR